MIIKGLPWGCSLWINNTISSLYGKPIVWEKGIGCKSCWNRENIDNISMITWVNIKGVCEGGQRMFEWKRATRVLKVKAEMKVSQEFINERSRKLISVWVLKEIIGFLKLVA